MAAATPPSPVDWTWPTTRPPPASSPPLELQLLPPAPFAPSDSPWGLDPSRLQQLMMGSAVSAATPVLNSSATCSSARDLGALFDDSGTGKALPSGWERCLDLQSGKIFLKKCDAAVQGLQSPYFEQANYSKRSGVETSRWLEALSTKTDEQRQDWSCRWKGEMVPTSSPPRESLHARKSFVNASARLCQNMDAPCAQDRVSMCLDLELDSPRAQDREPLCLDLELKLANEKRSKRSFEGQEAKLSIRPSNSNQSCVQESIQPWKWQEGANGGDKPAASIQEMAKESTMVTAVCAKCLMYVLLRKSNPICPRCSAPIVLDGALTSSSAKKRPRLDLSPDVLSFSTDSSR